MESSRFKTIIAQHYQIDPKNVEAFVIGEHGQYAVPVWSKVRIHGMELSEYEALSQSPVIDKAHITSIINEVSMDVFIKKVDQCSDFQGDYYIDTSDCFESTHNYATNIKQSGIRAR